MSVARSIARASSSSSSSLACCSRAARAGPSAKRQLSTAAGAPPHAAASAAAAPTTAAAPSPSSSRDKVIFSGIQPSGTIHLGNLLGALQNWRALAQAEPESTTILYSLVGLHAITLPKDPATLERERREMLAALLAMGLGAGGKGAREVLFCQDMVPEHAELAWILNCSTSMGKLQRMTTWKGKIAVHKNHASEADVSESDLNLGLFAYPVLQAADILLYKATDVPVGEDQQQHLELAREIARSFNGHFAPRKRPFFPEPRSLITPSKRILSLRNPSEKMSKSSPLAASRIELTDSSASIHKKFRGAVTDSLGGVTFDPVNRPGVANLLTILSACRPAAEESTPELEAERHEGLDMRAFKDEVASAVDGVLGPIRAELERLMGEAYLADRASGGKKGVRMKEEAFLREVAEDGARRARDRAAPVLDEVKRLVGLGRF